MVAEMTSFRDRFGQIILIILLFTTVSFSKESVFLTKEEQVYIKENPEVSIAMIEDYMPFAYVENDRTQGFSVDIVKLIAQKTGLNIKLIPDKWHVNIAKFKAKKIDLIADISYTKKRSKFTLFTQSYYKIPIIIFSRDDFGLYNDISDLEFKKVGIMKDIFYEEKLRNIDNLEVVELNNIEETMNALAYGKLDIAITTLQQGNFFIKKNSLTNIKILSRFDLKGISYDDLCIGVNKEKPILYSIINKGFRAISEYERMVLQQKWLGVQGFKNRSQSLELSKKEQEFIKKHPVIRISNEKDWAPFDYIQNNEPAGFSVDLAKLVAKKIGIEIEFVNDYTWSVLVNMFKNHKIDVLTSVGWNKDREKYGDFTQPYYMAKSNFIISKNSSEINSLADLNGKKIAIPKGWATETYLKNNHPEIKLLPVENLLKALEVVDQGNADATIELKSVASYYIKKHLFVDLKISGEFKELNENLKTGLYFLIRKDWKILSSLFKKALHSITLEEIEELKEKWLDKKQIEFRKIIFTKEELQYLDRHSSIRMCVDPDWLPYEKIDEKGKYEGMVAEYIAIFEKRIGKKIELVPTKTWSESIEFAKKRKCDIISAASITPSREKYMNFTTEYLTFPTVIATKTSVPFVENIESVLDKKFAVVKNYSISELLKIRYPDILLIEVENSSEAFELVRQEKVFGFIDALPTVSYKIQTNNISDLKIAGKTDIPFELCVAVRDDAPMLLSIFQKAVNSITKEEKREINKKWISVKYDQGFNYSLFWKIIGVVILILFFSLYWNRRLSKEIDSRRRTEMSLKKTSKELEIAKEKAESANRAKSEFLANMSHEFRTPLNAVIGFSELLSSMELNNKEKSFVQSIKTAGKSLLTLINDILDLSKIEVGMLEIEPKIINLKNILDEMRQIFEIQLENKGVKLFFEIDKQLPSTLVLDEVRVRQILLNIIGNAKKFTDKGYIKVIVKKIVAGIDKIDLLIAVEDTGIGISPDSILKVFEAFKQQEGHDSKKYGGTGLGLSICRRLIHAMGGEISVRSIVGKGSIFEVVLKDVPIASLSDDASDSRDSFNLENINFEKGNILVVDDIESNRVVIKELLSKIGFKVWIAENGQIALDLIKENKPDLIFMDIRMPVLDGMATTLKLKSAPETAHIPVVALTASSSSDDKEIIMKKGFDQYMEKPFKVDELLSVLSKYFKYKILEEKSIITERPTGLKLDEVKVPDELTAILNDEILPLCVSLKDAMVMSKIHSFGKKIKSLASRYNCDYLNKYGDQFITLTDNFDTVGIEEKLDELCNEIKQLNMG